MQNKDFRTQSIFVSILRFSAFLTLMGWALVHLFWDVPYRAFFWSESSLQWLVEGILGISWSAYVTSDLSDLLIQSFIQVVGVILLGAALVSLAPAEKIKKLRPLLLAGSLILLTVASLFFKETGWQLAMLLEFAAQVMAPAFLYLVLYTNITEKKLVSFLKATVALTFFCHGLYAIGYYPVPGNFIDMVIGVFNITEDQAMLFLKIAGIMDFILCIGLLFPRFQYPALTYAVVWGAMTALARPVSYIGMGGELEGLSYWVAQAVLRGSHAAIPLALLYLLATQKGWNFRIYSKLRLGNT